MKQSLLFKIFSFGLILMLGFGLQSCSDDAATPPKKAAATTDLPLDVVLPSFETTPSDLDARTSVILTNAKININNMIKVSSKHPTFYNTIAEFDNILYPVTNRLNQMELIANVHPDPAMMEAAEASMVTLQNWLTSLDFREDLYQAVKAFEATNTTLTGEDVKLFQEILLDFKRAGMNLPEETQRKVENLQLELNQLGTEFDQELRLAQETLSFSKEELQGVPDDFLESIKQENGNYLVKAHITGHFMMVMENADNEEVRKKLKIARYRLAMDKNNGRLNKMIATRDKIAKTLGYPSWADYRIEPHMAKTVDAAKNILNEISTRLDPRFSAELKRFRELKASDQNKPNEETEIYIWDWRYYANKLMKQDYSVDSSELRYFFPMERSLQGMFDVYNSLFDITISEISEIPYKWTEDLKLFKVTDKASSRTLGYLYMDLYPRENKYNHFAQFGIIDGKLLPNGTYRHPVAALVCNFPTPSQNSPSLLSHSDLETLFHEFGHAMHTLLTTAKYSRFSGTSVEQDFVEAPSQMLEAWVWEKSVLDRFATDSRDPSRKIDADLLKRMKEAKEATKGTVYKRQIALALSDLEFHSAGETKDSAKIFSETFEKVFLAPPADTHMAAYWGHMNGYDASYYAYAWSDTITADLLTAFRSSPQGLMDHEIGMKLRNEIYAVGGSRPIEESIEAFLGRSWSPNAFLDELSALTTQ